MSKDILGMYGPDSPSNQQPRATNGGIMPVKPVPYSTPQGPMGIMDKGIGIGTTMGTHNGFGGTSESGSPGNKGTNHGNCGSQGCR